MYTVDEIQGASPDYFIMRGDSFENAESDEVCGTKDTDVVYYYPVEGTEFGYAPTLDLTAGDVLVTTSGSESKEFYSAEDQGYFGENAWDIVNTYNWETINGIDIPDDWTDLTSDEQGAFLSDALASRGITLDHGYVPVSESPTTLTYSEFVGTVYNEYTVELNVPFYRRFVGYWNDQGEETTFECPSVETREGYFIVDTSALESGTYFFKGRSQGYTNYYARINVIA